MYSFLTLKTRFNHQIFIKDDYFNIVSKTIFHCSNLFSITTIAFVLMPNHLHWLCESKDLRGGSSDPPLKSWVNKPGLSNPGDRRNNLRHNYNNFYFHNKIENHPESNLRGGSDDPPLKNWINKPGLSNPGIKQYFKIDNKIIHGLKGYTGKKIISLMKANQDPNLEKLTLKSLQKGQHYFSLWQSGYYNKHFLLKKEVLIKIKYIQQNPIKQGLIDYQYIYVYKN